MITIFEKFREIYGISPGDNVLFKHTELKNIMDKARTDIIIKVLDLPKNISSNELKYKYIPSFFKNKVGKFIDYHHYDDFFGTVEFIFNGKKLELDLPVYMLITEIEYHSEKYNL